MTMSEVGVADGVTAGVMVAVMVVDGSGDGGGDSIVAVVVVVVVEPAVGREVEATTLFTGLIRLREGVVGVEREGWEEVIGRGLVVRRGLVGDGGRGWGGRFGVGGGLGMGGEGGSGWLSSRNSVMLSTMAAGSEVVVGVVVGTEIGWLGWEVADDNK